MLASEIIAALPAMLITTAVGLIAGLLSIVLRPFARHHELGRQLGNLAIIIGVASPIFFFLDLGPALLRGGRLILMSPVVIGVVARAMYPKQAPETRGFEVLPPDRRDPGAG